MLVYKDQNLGNKKYVDAAFIALYGQYAFDNPQVSHMYLGLFKTHEHFINFLYYDTFGSEIPSYIKLNVEASWEYLRNIGYDSYDGYYFWQREDIN